MADLALTSLGVPSSVGAIFQLAKFIIERINRYRNAPEMMNKLKAWSYDLFEGQMLLNIKVVQERLLAHDSIDVQVRIIAETHIAKLENTLKEARKIVEKSIGIDGQVSRANRWYFSTTGMSALQQVLRDLTEFQDSFCVFVVLAVLYREVPLRKPLLTRDRFCLIPRNRGGNNGSAEYPEPKISFARAEYKNTKGAIEEVDVLIEVQDTRERSKMDTEIILEQLSSHLLGEPACGGILQCLGYWMDLQAALIFRLPCVASKVTTLQKLVVQTGDRPSISSRLALTTALSKAVLSVHGTGLVHKSIRQSPSSYF